METSVASIGFTDTLSGIATAFGILQHVISALFALGVWRDAGRLNRNGTPVAFVSGQIWALATLLTGITTAFAYWAIHHSALARKG